MSTKIKYEIESTEVKKVGKKKLLSQEEQLKELLNTLPTLKKHNMAGEVETKVKQLRSGRKSRSFNLKLSRKFSYETVAEDGTVTKHSSISAEAPVEKAADKYAVLRALKEQVIKKIKEARKNRLPQIESHTIDSGFSVPYLDFVYLEPNSILNAMYKKIRFKMKDGKKPTDPKIKYVGVEIELAAQEDRETLCDAIFAAGIGKHICVKNDGSIGAGEERTGVASKLLTKYKHPHEICILAPESEIESVITKLCKVLNETLHTAVDRSCGLHVHLDMRGRDPKLCFNNLVLSQQWLYAMLPAQRRNSRYSIPIKGPEWRDRPDSRYYGVNAEAYHVHKTIELRMHCGTTNAHKINNWIKLGIAICDAPAFKSAPTTVAAFKAAARLSDPVLEYVKGRIAKFADQHKKNVPSAEQPGTMPDLERVDAVADTTAAEDSEVA